MVNYVSQICNINDYNTAEISIFSIFSILLRIIVSIPLSITLKQIVLDLNKYIFKKIDHHF